MPGFEVIGKEELAQIETLFANGGVLFRHSFDALRNDCYMVRDFERAFAKSMRVPHALAVSSGTAALRVALAALGIGAGDEVITQSFTFVATVEAIVESGATPICADINKTLNLDPEDLERRITPNTKAVIAVHMLGMPARLKEIKAICEARSIALIEDTAWGCGGALEGKPLGTWGDIGTFSFDFAKTMTTGEGGMLVMHDQSLYEKAAAWHDHGHENNPSVPRWEDTRSSSGFNYRMTEMQGAVGLAQLKKLPDVVRRQRQNAEALWNAISDLPYVEAREAPAQAMSTYDALIFFVCDNDMARACRAALLEAGYGTKILPEAYTWHFAGTWEHIHSLKVAHGGDLRKAFERSEQLLSRAVSLPVSVNMDERVPSMVRKALYTVLKNVT